MIFTHRIVLFLFCVTNTWALEEYYDFSGNFDDTDDLIVMDNNEVYLKLFQNNLRGSEKVRIQLYYESLCPYCIQFDVNEFAPVVQTMSSYLDIHTYPFGNAEMIDKNGKLEFICQHGPSECYGNKLHACALDKLIHTTALLYNICLMNCTDGLGSDDESADMCGESMSIDAEPIKECAKGTRGMELLKYYGEESKKAHFSYVPYVLINGKVYVGNNFKKAVCEVFSNPPPVCK